MTRQTGLLVLAASLAVTGTARAQNNHTHWGEAWSGSGPGLYLHSTDQYALLGWTDAPTGFAILGYASSQAGDAYGVLGSSMAPNGAGVYGAGSSTTGSTTGVYGRTVSPRGAGIYGWADATAGPTYGVYGRSDSPQGIGVYGTAPFPAPAGYFNGNTVVAAPGSLSFGSATRQMLSLWGPGIYGIGVQKDALYFRTDGNSKTTGFAWFKGGKHNDNPYDAGGGAVMMTLDDSGLTVNGTFVSSSDAAVKQDVAPLDVQRVLEAVGRLPINEWSYRADPQVRHVGPMAQDFQSAFGLGADDKHIAMVDADGVALAAIQALKQLASTQQAEIGELRSQTAEIAGLRAQVAELLARQAR